MTKKITIELPNSLARAAEDFAAKDGVTLDRFIGRALVEKIGAMNAAEFFAERGKGADVEWAIWFLEGRPELKVLEGG